MTDIVRLDRISKHFGTVIGVDDVSLNVRKGEFLTLLGPSGCGKSTLLRMIGGFEEPTAGRVWLDGEDVTDRSPNRRAVNMLFQDYALFPHMNVGRNVGYGLKVAGVPKREVDAKVRDVLDLVGLTDKIDAAPQQLSGGQRQRVALARAIVRRPKVLLLDEPLSALDANLREAMQVELRHLHQKVGLTFIMVTHDQTEALTMSDRVIVMRDGRIVQDGVPQSLYDSPNSPYIASFIGTTNLFASRVEGGRVTCHGQPLRIEPAEIRQGSEMFGFRPEKAKLHRGDAQGDNLLRGIVTEVLYHGSVARIIVGLEDASILVDLPISDAGLGLPAIGEAVAVEIEPHKIMVFAPGAAA
jgi:ABC-type Fe3+/spermidine/putrescine transport system ATPase subunit